MAVTVRIAAETSSYTLTDRATYLQQKPPAMVHYGFAEGVRDRRTTVLAAAYAAHPERFVHGVPRPAPLPAAAWINPPLKKPERQDAPGTTIVTPRRPEAPPDFARTRARWHQGGPAVT